MKKKTRSVLLASNVVSFGELSVSMTPSQFLQAVCAMSQILKKWNMSHVLPPTLCIYAYNNMFLIIEI